MDLIGKAEEKEKLKCFKRRCSGHIRWNKETRSYQCEKCGTRYERENGEMKVTKKRVYFKMELKEGKKGNLIVVVKFDPEASNFYEDFTWCPTLDELDVLNKARERVME